VVEEGAVKEVFSEGQTPKLAQARIIDLKGKTLMPGLIDAHVPTLTVCDLVAKEGRDGLDAYSIEKLEIVGYKGLQALEMAYQKGVKIGSGSDIIGLIEFFT
jgi:imidazolonepropionase-like amidohydrolase